ncbi:hypothetical protein [Streptomyces sp. VRA16 Mangrove soil]|uniref:hypothetical protein n=1 Tax=Streptomyces sp. VRA16 Mangrove soil TaxID=2817434 RepID=UPI001A9D8D4B|nr:hypothetical protein [Streptomyces sp. VRA16 Mangrove soil]MBO1335126.1 hypothetical protein [Streptomyces sp. VRA16 Mangrove soil]
MALPVLAVALLVLAGALRVVLAADFYVRPVRDRARREHEADTPPALTAVETPWPTGPGRVLPWIAVAAWAVVLAGAVRHRGSAGAARPLRSRAPR